MESRIESHTGVFLSTEEPQSWLCDLRHHPGCCKENPCFCKNKEQGCAAGRQVRKGSLRSREEMEPVRARVVVRDVGGNRHIRDTLWRGVDGGEKLMLQRKKGKRFFQFSVINVIVLAACGGTKTVINRINPLRVFRILRQNRS